MTDLESVWAELDADPQTSPGVLLRRVNVPGFDVHLTQERPSRRPGFFVEPRDEPGVLWKDLRSSQGLDAKVEARPGRDLGLILTERDIRFHDVFAALVVNLIRGLEALASEPPGSRPLTLDFLSARIARWQACLQANHDGLSGEKTAGLFGELSTLTSLLAAGVDPVLVVDRWTGPSGAIQDFQFDQLTLEVKASRQTQPTNVRISSERQLDDTTHAQLVLVHYALDERSDSSGTSLPEKVVEVRSLLGSGHASLLFDDRLIDYGYLDLHAPRYADRSYAIRATDHFRVTDPMPRIVENDLRVGVGRVSYDLSLAACDPFRIPTAQIAGLLAGANA